MAADTQKLIKDWIQYLKNSQIVALKSDPNTGKLNYKRPVTSEDVTKFLEAKTRYTPEQISNAIHMVMAKNAQGAAPKQLSNEPAQADPESPEGDGKKPGTDVSTWMHHGMRPGDPKNRLQGEPSEQPKQVGGTPNNKLNYDPNSVSDIDYRDVPKKDPEALPAPSEKRKPRFKLRTKGINEDFEENQGYTLDENDVEQVFNILAGGEADTAPAADTQGGRAAPEAGEANQPDPEALNKIKRTIRDTMTDSQRKALWRALNEVQ